MIPHIRYPGPRGFLALRSAEGANERSFTCSHLRRLWEQENLWDQGTHKVVFSNYGRQIRITIVTKVCKNKTMLQLFHPHVHVRTLTLPTWSIMSYILTRSSGLVIFLLWLLSTSPRSCSLLGRLAFMDSAINKFRSMVLVKRMWLMYVYRNWRFAIWDSVFWERTLVEVWNTRKLILSKLKEIPKNSQV